MNQLKFENVVLFICENTRGQMNMVRLNKLLWLIDKTAFLRLAHTLTDWRYIRKEMGPVPFNNHDALGVMKDKGLLKISHINDENGEKYSFSPLKRADISCFDAEEQAVIKEVLEKYGSMHWLKLVKLSHDLAWATYEDGETIPFEAYLSSPPESADNTEVRILIDGEEDKYAQNYC